MRRMRRKDTSRRDHFREIMSLSVGVHLALLKLCPHLRPTVLQRGAGSQCNQHRCTDLDQSASQNLRSWQRHPCLWSPGGRRRCCRACERWTATVETSAGSSAPNQGTGVLKSLNSRTKSAPMTTAATIERIGPVPVPSVNSRGTCGRTARARLSLPKQPALSSKRSPEQAEGCAPCGSSRSC